MESINSIISQISSFVWGPVMLVAILGTGIYLTFGTKLFSIRKIFYAFKLLFKGQSQQSKDVEAKDRSEKSISPFNALMTSLSATIGTGNIAGVGTAIAMGGPGALFWMWITALVGMATKYAEAVCAVKYRETDESGKYVGGPMYYIKNGLGKKWLWLATLFAIFGATASFGIGNMVQVNSVADLFASNYYIPKIYTGIAIAVLIGLIVFGGITRIGAVAGKLVPVMAVSYLTLGLGVIFYNIELVPAAFSTIIDSAFNPTAAAGGFAGASVWMAIRFGVARGVFSNEAGLGSAPIAHAASSTTSPVKQGCIAMLGTFIDTIIVCSITGLVIIMSGEYLNGMSGSPLSSDAFASFVPGFGDDIVTIGLAVFAFTTILGWSYYGEKCVQYLAGQGSVFIFRVLWLIVIPLGATFKLSLVWNISDVLNALMALPNLIALILLSPVVFKLTKEFVSNKK